MSSVTLFSQPACRRWSFDFTAKAAQVRIPHIIRQDEDNIGSFGSICVDGQTDQPADQREQDAVSQNQDLGRSFPGSKIGSDRTSAW